MQGLRESSPSCRRCVRARAGTRRVAKPAQHALARRVFSCEGGDMTRIAQRKTRLRLQTAALFRSRPLVVEISRDGYGLTIRERGRRAAYSVSWATIYTVAATQAAHARRAEQLARRKGAR